MDRLTKLVLIAVLVGYAVLGVYAVPAADDFCQSVDAFEYGILGAVERGYTGWNGRYSHLLIASVAAFAGPVATQITPALLIAGLVASIWYAARPISSKPFIVALAVTSGFVAALPHPWQSLYWLPGSLTYTLPLILVAVSVGVLTNRHAAWLLLPLALVAGGFNEGLSLLQAVGFAVALVIWRGRRDIVPGVAGAVVALALVVAAPGNAARAEALNLAARPAVPFAVYLSLRTSLQLILATWLHISPVIVLVGLVARQALPAVRLRPASRATAMAVVFLALVAIGGVTLFPGNWAGIGTYGRIWTTNALVIVVGSSLLLWLSGVPFRRWVVVLALCGPVLAVLGLSRHQPALAAGRESFERGEIALEWAALTGLDSGEWVVDCYER